MDLLDLHWISSVSFPVLSKLRMLGFTFEEDLTLFINTTPSLSSLSLENALDVVPQELNYAQLSHLGFVPSQVDIQNLFNKCPNFLSLRIEESWTRPSVVGPTMITCSSKLELLTVRHGHWGFNLFDASNSVFPLLRLPSLKTLRLEMSKFGKPVTDGEPWGNFEPFMVFVKQSSFQSTSFSIQQLSLSDANLVDILVLLPTLLNLTVNDSGISPRYSSISSNFVESLHGYRTSSLRPQAAAIVPRLRSLRLLNVGAKAFSDLSV